MKHHLQKITVYDPQAQPSERFPQGIGAEHFNIKSSGLKLKPTNVALTPWLSFVRKRQPVPWSSWRTSQSQSMAKPAHMLAPAPWPSWRIDQFQRHCQAGEVVGANAMAKPASCPTPAPWPSHYATVQWHSSSGSGSCSGSA